MSEILFYILDSSFWMWVICIMLVCIAIAVYTDELPINNRLAKIITLIFLCLLAWGAGSMARENGITNCVNNIIKADYEGNYLGYHLPYNTVRAICENN